MEVNKYRKWSDYVNCVNLPNPKCPPELRQYLLKWKTVTMKRLANDYTWELQVDSRSILNHKMNALDLTRKTIAKNQPDIGVWYCDMINHNLKVLETVQDVLEEGQVEDMTLLNDLLEVGILYNI